MKKENYSNIVAYVKNEMSTFEEVPFCEADSLVLSWLVYFHFIKEKAITESEEGINIREIFRAEDFDQLMTNVWSQEESMELLVACLASPRFRNIRLLHYHEEMDLDQKKQFAAITYRLPGNMYYICFRGTDWSLIGWEEDFKMSLKDPVPSQLQAVKYLRFITEKYDAGFYVGGHSKGGNLAVYASAMVPEEIQEKIIAVYSHDGPGFHKEDVEKEGFVRIRSRIYKSVPEFSVFGLMFEQEADYKIVHSYETGIMQHNSLFWEVRDGKLVEEEELSSVAGFLRGRLNQLLDRLDYEGREKVIDTVFDILRAPGEESFEMIGQDWYHNSKVMLKKIKDMDPELHHFLLERIKKSKPFQRQNGSEEETNEKKNKIKEKKDR